MAVFSVFWFAEIGNIHWSRILRSVRIGAFGRRIYGGSFSKRFRVRRTNPDGKRAFAGNEQAAGGEAYYSPAGDFNQCTGICRKYHIFAEGDECVFSNQFDGLDVYSKRLDRLVL